MRLGNTRNICGYAATFSACPAHRRSHSLTAQSAPTLPSAASAPPWSRLPPSRHRVYQTRPAQGTRFTGPRPTLPAPSDWLFQVTVILGLFGLVGGVGEGRVSGSVGRAGTRMCVVAAAEELEGELRGLWMRRTRRPR